MKSKKEHKIQFEPFIKFVIEFHNTSLSYSNILNNKIAQHPEILDKKDMAQVEEAFLVKHMADWETFTLNILSYCVAIDTSKISEHLDLELPKKLSFDNAVAIINGLSYLSITSSSELKGLARKILSEKSNPYEQFTTKFLKTIDETYTLRNYIAHKSKKSKLSLQKMYKDRYQIDTFIEPGDFLSQTLKNDIGEYPRSHQYYGNFMMIATMIWRHLDPKSYEFVYEDENTNEGWLKGMVKMNQVFEHLTKEFKL